MIVFWNMTGIPIYSEFITNFRGDTMKELFQWGTKKEYKS